MQEDIPDLPGFLLHFFLATVGPLFPLFSFKNVSAALIIGDACATELAEFEGTAPTTF